MSNKFELNGQSKLHVRNERIETGVNARGCIADIGQTALHELHTTCALGAGCHVVMYVEETADRATLAVRCENCPNADALQRVAVSAAMQVEPEEWRWHAILVHCADQKR